MTATMNPFWIALLLAIGTSMAGQTLLKAGAGAASFFTQLLDWRTVIGLGLYGGAALLYIVALRRIPMSVALPCTAVSYVAAALIGNLVFGEPLPMIRVAAIAVIATGVAMLAWAT
ncbi:MAG TPA: multidrug transporter [Acetobacteraceae bacterium]|jgi:multidrug transporter EmrE-like cation transporter|nr:multidrug transporter [Acetobacteraceae bacterium]